MYFLFSHWKERKILSLALSQNTKLLPAWIPERAGKSLFSVSVQAYLYFATIFEKGYFFLPVSTYMISTSWITSQVITTEQLLYQTWSWWRQLLLCVWALIPTTKSLLLYQGKFSQPSCPLLHLAVSLYHLQSVLYWDDIAFGIYIGSYFITPFSRKVSTLRQKPHKALCGEGLNRRMPAWFVFFWTFPE